MATGLMNVMICSDLGDLEFRSLLNWPESIGEHYQKHRWGNVTTFLKKKFLLCAKDGLYT